MLKSVTNLPIMKRIICIVFAALGIAVVSKAQPVQTDSLVLSLAQAQELGIKNRYDVKANSYSIDIAQKEVVRSKQAWLPNVNFKGDVRYSPQVQGTFVPAGFAGFTDPVIIALGAKSISVFNFELDQTIYSPATGIDIKIATNEKALQREQNRGKETDIKKRISLAYLNALLRSLQYRIAQQEEIRLLAYLTVANGRYKNGAIIENDYLRARLDYENSRQQVTISKQNYELSLVTLRYQLNVPADTKLKLTDSLGEPDNQNLPVPVPGLNAIQSRTEIRQLQLQQQADNLQMRRQRRMTLPTLSFVGNYAAQHLSQDFNFSYANTDMWSAFNSVGLRLNVPLSAHFTNRNSTQETQLRAFQTEALQQQTTLDINYQVTQSQTDLSNAIQNLQTAKASYDLAQQVYKNQSDQLELGGLSYDQLFNTESSLASSESNYISAVYQCMIAKLNYDIAIGVF